MKNTIKYTQKGILRISAAAIALLMLCSCSNTSDSSGIADENKSDYSPEQTTAYSGEAQTEALQTEDFFGSGYDPLADDYDPYGGSGASTSTGSGAKLIDTPVGDTSDETASTAETTAAAVTAASSESASYTAAAEITASETERAVTDGVLLSLNISNSWESGSDKYIQLDGTVSCKGTSIGSWSAEIPVGKAASAEQSWNCSLSLENGTLKVSPVDYNSAVSDGGESTFGLILKNAGDIDPSSASITASTGSSMLTSSGTGSSYSAPTAYTAAKDIPEPTTDDWLHTDGSRILDSSGKEVWLTGINWFGYNTGTNTFDGLWTCDLNTSIASIANRGFNLLRVPISAELILDWSEGSYPTANFNQATNSYLVGMNSLEIFDYVVGQCRANGLKIMIDIHSAKTDASGHNANMWYNGDISEQDYLDALSWIAERYALDDTIIAYDLKNEPHGKPAESPRAKWDGSTDSDNWKYIAEKAANAVLSKNPNALIVVEGIEIYPTDIKTNGDFSSQNSSDYYFNWWGGNLRGVKDNPVNLGKYQNKLVYSPHDYGPTVYSQPWFSGDYTYESLYNDVWYDNWFYIQASDTAPLLIGEWGGYMTQPNLKWMTYLRQLIKENRINHTFWCFNSNSGDTGGLVKDDFTTWDEEKYEFVKEVLWQENGKFVGLDHEIPLGENGTTLK